MKTLSVFFSFDSTEYYSNKESAVWRNQVSISFSIIDKGIEM